METNSIDGTKNGSATSFHRGRQRRWLESAFEEATRARNTGLAVTAGSVASSNRKRIADLAAKYRLPAIFDREEFVASGGFMSYGTSIADVYRRLATFVDKILKGTKPSDLPIERPTKFELAINLKTANQMGLTIPPNVLARADKVIK